MFGDTKTIATQKAKELLKKVEGSRWKIRIWENAGWQYCLQAHFICLHEYGNTYHAMIGTKISDGTGLSLWLGDKTDFKCPNKAIKYAIENAERELVKLTYAVDGAKNSIKMNYNDREKAKIHKSHKLGKSFTEPRAYSSTPRFYSVQVCKNCKAEIAEHAAGLFIDKELKVKCTGKEKEE